MSGAFEYELDLKVLEAVIRRLPDTFDTYDVSRHPDVMAAHTVLASHRAWHSVVNLFLSRQERLLEALPSRRRGMPMWRRIKRPHSFDLLDAPTATHNFAVNPLRGA
jgi:hypothetical protein